MEFSATRSGGIAGLSTTWVVTVDDDGPDAAEWRALVDALPRGPRPLAPAEPDRYVYRIRCPGRRATLPEQQLLGPWRELVDRIRESGTALTQP